MTRPRLLDLFSGEGAAARGYARAGFEVHGVDNRPSKAKYYPYEFTCADALEYLRKHGTEYDAIHASPPCQRYTHGNVMRQQSERHPDLIGPTRNLLRLVGVPWIIENVPRSPLREPMVLCGTMFDLVAIDDDDTVLHLRRHRWFESPLNLWPPSPCRHKGVTQWAGAYGGARNNKVDARTVRRGGYVPHRALQEQLMGIEPGSMTLGGLQQGIPPAYTEHLGKQLMGEVLSEGRR